MALVSLVRPIIFTNGVKFELKVDDVTNAPYICMSEGPLAGLLSAVSLDELALPTDLGDMAKISRVLGLAAQVLLVTTPAP